MIQTVRHIMIKISMSKKEDESNYYFRVQRAVSPDF